MPYLTHPLAYKSKQRTYRYFVELASRKLDYWGIPHHCPIVDVVMEDNSDAIKTLKAGCGWLAGYEIVSFWQPEEETPF